MTLMQKFLGASAVLALTACGDNTLVSNGGGPGPGGGPPVAAITVLASSPSLPSDSGQSLTIQAIVRDQNNVAMEGVTVIMASDSGTLTFTNPVTDLRTATRQYDWTTVAPRYDHALTILT